MNIRRIITGLYLLFLSAWVFATVSPDPIFQDNMVLQRNKAISIFGKATTENEVSISFNNKDYVATVKNGRWNATIESVKAGGPYTLSIKGSNTLTYSNILIGDVWVCTGQSNMAYTLYALVNKYPEVFETQDLNYSNDEIRYIWTRRVAADLPKEETEVVGSWEKITPSSSLKCSATAYFFAKKIQDQTGIPQGLVLANHGGTSVNSWVSNEVLKSRTEYKHILDDFRELVDNYDINFAQFEKDLAKWIDENVKEGEKFSTLPWDRKKHAPRAPLGSNHIKRPAGLYNGMIAPLTQLSVAGIIWYQGENEAYDFNDALWYNPMFKDMITEWRSQWGSTLPFYFAQLAAFQSPSETPVESEWVRLREAQAAALELPLTGMAVLTDAGKKNDIHPPYKKQAGERMALHALKDVYQKQLISSGPRYKSHTLSGNKYHVVFDNLGEGLQTNTVLLDDETIEKTTLKGFSICEKKLNWKWANAKIINDSTVEVWHDEIVEPFALRYAWASFPLCNLYNSESLPAVPFRTDSLPHNALPSGVNDIYEVIIPEDISVGEQVKLRISYSATVASEIHLSLFQKTPWKNIITASSKVTEGSGWNEIEVHIPSNATAGPHTWVVSIGAENSNWRDWVGKTNRNFNLKAALTSSLESIKKPEYVVYPNPTQDHFFVSGLRGTEQITLFNLKNKALKQTSQVQNEMNISEFNAGLYLVQIKSESKSSIHKLIIL